MNDSYDFPSIYDILFSFNVNIIYEIILNKAPEDCRH